MKKTKNYYKQCTRCVLDETVLDITYDENGVCNYCSGFLEKSKVYLNESIHEKTKKLENLVESIKAQGLGKDYDCIVGVSGGVDSSWVLVKAVELGLKPLAVHMDNGWNADLSVSNIKNLVDKLKVDLHIYKIDDREYDSLLKSFLKADVVDIEVLYDNAMLAVNYMMAKKFDIKYILSGSNLSTEGIRVPTGWNWLKKDKKNIYSIANSFGGIKIKSLPTIGTLDFIRYEFIRGIKWLPFLDFFVFNKEEALSVLERDYSYIRYPFKHYESILTRFYQGYILPNKFNIDKRKLHFSTLIITNQVSRKDALLALNGIAYESQEVLEKDKETFIKKLNWTQSDLDNYLARKERSHLEYGSEKWFWDLCHKTYSLLKGIGFGK